MIGQIVHDCGLGRNGIVVSGEFIEKCDNMYNTLDIDWEWLVLYEDGELAGADTNELKVIE